MKTIEILISPEGKVKLETHGFTGSACREASRFLEDAIGIGTVERLKNEYFLKENNNLQHKEQCQC